MCARALLFRSNVLETIVFALRRTYLSLYKYGDLFNAVKIYSKKKGTFPFFSVTKTNARLGIARLLEEKVLPEYHLVDTDPFHTTVFRVIFRIKNSKRILFS